MRVALTYPYPEDLAWEVLCDRKHVFKVSGWGLDRLALYRRSLRANLIIAEPNCR